MKKIIPFLICMTVFSCFAGMSINNNWFFTYQFELYDYPDVILARRSNIRDISLWLVLVLSHLGIVLLPFFTRQHSFRKLLLYLPTIYLIAYFLLRPEFLLLLIPFIIIWLLALRRERKLARISSDTIFRS
jgi:hypothetical protein